MSRWHSCNVVEVGAATRHVWQFDARNGKFPLSREETPKANEPLPARLVGKSWSSLWQKKLNVAWLPPENVFIRVAQFPKSEPDELRSMVEFQLEKLSPIPVTQAVWSMHPLGVSASVPAEGPGPKPQGDGGVAATPMQTLVVVIAQRNAVEEFLGKLEGQGFLADRLELPLLDQLQATTINGDGAWIYPDTQGGSTALVAWWYGGVLQNLDLVHLHSGADQANGLKDQLVQMTWAGELEGWLTSPPRWHLIADEMTAASWAPLLEKGLEQPVEVSPPLPRTELASRTAQRAARSEQKDNLLPPEFATRYSQQFQERLWIRGLGAVVLVYVLFVAVRLIATGFLAYKTNTVESTVQSLGLNYTNAIKLQQEYDVLKKRHDLKFAALDCWEAVAELQPENVTLNSLSFKNGESLFLSGTAPPGEALTVSDFVGKLRKATAHGQPLFDPNKGKSLQTHLGAGGVVDWSFELELNRTENL